MREKNANGLAIAVGGGIFSGISDESGRYIITDYYHKVGPILKLPEKVITQNGYVLPVVGIGGEDFRTVAFNTIEINPLTERFRFEDASFYQNKNIEIVDCSKAAKLEYLEIGDSAFAGSSLKSIVAPLQKVEIVTEKDAYAQAPIENYTDYLEHLAFLDSQKPSGFWSFFKKAPSDNDIDEKARTGIIGKAKYVLNKLKSIINLACISKSYMGAFGTDLNSVASAIKNNETNSLGQSDCELLLNVDSLLKNEDYDSQINVKPSKIGNNSNEPNDNDNNNYPDNVDLFAFATVAQDIINGSPNFNENDALHKSDDADNDNDNGDFNDHSGNNNDNDNDDDHNNSQGPKKFVAANGNSEASEQQSDNESQKIQAEVRMESDSNNKAANSENEDNNDVVAKANVKKIKSKAQTEATDNDDSDSQKISVDEFLARGSLSSDNKDDAASVEEFIKQNPVQTINDRETAKKIFEILNNFLGENALYRNRSSAESTASDYILALESIFNFENESESDEKNDNFSDSYDNRNDNDNSSDFSKHDGNNDNDNDGDNDDDNTPKKLKTKTKKSNKKPNKNRGSIKTRKKSSAKTGNKKKISAKKSDIDLKNADNGNSKEQKVEAMPEESNNNALEQEVVATKEENNNNNRKPEAVVATDKSSNDNDNANSIDHGKIIQQGNCGANGDNVKFVKYEDNHVDILGEGAMANYTKEQLAPWGTDIKSVTISPSVTSVGDYIFCGCSNLTEAHVSDTVKSFGKWAFAGTGLTSFNIPHSVTSIGSFAFGSSQLESIFIPNNVENLGNYVFSDCNKLETVTIEEGITSFSDATNMFKGCESLKTVNLPSTCLSLGEYMFAGCTSLEEIKLYGGQVPRGTFMGCTSLKKVNAPNLHIVKNYAFEGCENLTSISFANIEQQSEIGNNAFDGCQKLTNVNLGKVKKIEDSAFENCTSLEKIVIPSELRKFRNHAFYGCENLTDVTYEGRSVLEYRSGIFENCEKLKRIKLTSNWKGGNDFCGYPVVGNEVIVNDNDESLNKSQSNKKS